MHQFMPESLRRLDALERRIEMLERLILAMPSTTGTQSAFLDQLARQPDRYQQPAPRALGDPLPEPLDPTWISVYHRMDRNDPDWPVRPCGMPGLFLTRPIHEGERARFDLLRIMPPGETQWRAPTVHDEPRCQSCRALIDPFSSADLDYLSVMRPAGESRQEPPERPLGSVGSSPQDDPAPGPDGSPLPPSLSPEAKAETLDILKRLSRDLFTPPD